MASIFDLDEFESIKEGWNNRQTTLRRFWNYYKADYEIGGGSPKSAPGQYVQSLVKNQIKPIFTPLGRAVNLDVALIPGGWRLDADSQIYRDNVQEVFDLSEWDTEGDLLCRWYAAMGEAGIRIVDDPDTGNAYMAPVSPRTYMIGGRPQNPDWALFVEMRGEDEYATLFTKENVTTWVEGQNVGFDGRPAKYRQALGRVPLVVALNDGGDGVPEPTFDDTLTALDQVNQQASHMAAMIFKHVEPQWAAFGTEAADLEKSGDNVWFFPEGSDIKAVLAAVDFAGLLSFVREIKEEMKESLPELALRDLVGVNRIAAATIELQMAEAVFKIRRLRKPLDTAVGKALEICTGAQTRIRLDKQRPVIVVDAMTRLELESKEAATELSKLALQRELALGQGG